MDNDVGASFLLAGGDDLRWRCGTVVGRFDGDPLADIAVLQDRERIELVMKDGQIYRDELSD